MRPLVVGHPPTSEAVALGFIDSLERAYGRIARHPATGSPRYAHELSLPWLRAWPLTRFPYLVFYIEHPDHIDVWRVLHGQRDILAWMQEPDDASRPLRASPSKPNRPRTAHGTVTPCHGKLYRPRSFDNGRKAEKSADGKSGNIGVKIRTICTGLSRKGHDE